MPPRKFRTVKSCVEALGDPEHTRHDNAIRYVEWMREEGNTLSQRIIDAYELIRPLVDEDESETTEAPDTSEDEAPPYDSEDEEVGEVVMERVAQNNLQAQFNPPASAPTPPPSYESSEDEQPEPPAEPEPEPVEEPVEQPTDERDFSNYTYGHGIIDASDTHEGVRWDMIYWKHPVGDVVDVERRDSPRIEKCVIDWVLPTWMYYNSVESITTREADVMISLLCKKAWWLYKGLGRNRINKRRRREVWEKIWDCILDPALDHEWGGEQELHSDITTHSTPTSFEGWTFEEVYAVVEGIKRPYTRKHTFADDRGYYTAGMTCSACGKKFQRKVAICAHEKSCKPAPPPAPPPATESDEDSD